MQRKTYGNHDFIVEMSNKVFYDAQFLQLMSLNGNNKRQHAR